MYLSRSARTPVSGAHPRFNIPAIASKYDLRIADPGRRSAAGNNERPGRSEGTGSATASRIVGRMSTWRADTDEISPSDARVENAKCAKAAEFAKDAKAAETRLIKEFLWELCELCVPW